MHLRHLRHLSAFTKESIIDQTYSFKISPNPSFLKRGNSSLWQREGRRDLVLSVYTIMA
jgi:hypothetical protein